MGLLPLELTAVCEGERAPILTKHFVCMVCPYTGENSAVFSLLFKLSSQWPDRPNDLTLLITNCPKEYWPQIPTLVFVTLFGALQRTFHFQLLQYQICTDVTEGSCDWLTHRPRTTLPKLVLSTDLCFSCCKQELDERGGFRSWSQQNWNTCFDSSERVCLFTSC